MLVFAITVVCLCLSATVVVSLILHASKLWKFISPALNSARTTVLWLFAVCPWPPPVSVRGNFGRNNLRSLSNPLQNLSKKLDGQQDRESGQSVALRCSGLTPDSLPTPFDVCGIRPPHQRLSLYPVPARNALCDSGTVASGINVYRAALLVNLRGLFRLMPASRRFWWL